ncbi:hypothetical protein [Wielerella bovis]|uniref:hypothetical protein n=1 Tax=Wielerella bovis TaxID=2917790 RepID=UPI00201948BD|nr:hypothetical protein [Wielerella bovis]ULJ60613.1 hypothetical protein MIS44_01675 [Wielerella bovis]ULJ60623.1 hypothetical protein MIS44_01725 [Wielerella bovis]
MSNHGVSITGNFLKVIETASKETGEIKNHVHLLVLGDEPLIVKIKTHRAAFWKKAQTGTVTIPVKLFTPNDRAVIYYSEVQESKTAYPDDEVPFGEGKKS